MKKVKSSVLYTLLSAAGEVVKVEVGNGSYDVIRKLPGFTRGFVRDGDYLFVGLSSFRKSHTFGYLGRADIICGRDRLNYE